ncbi:MAG: hypothetical protein ABIJ56_21950 [Pseudomonadota bacterium]
MKNEHHTPFEDEREHAETAEAAAGWEAISEWTGGIKPEDVQDLVSVRELEQVYPLLHALVGRSPRDFLVRAAAMEALVADGRGCFFAGDLDQVLYWLDEDARQSALRALRRSGWLSYDPGEGTQITDLGRWAYDVLSFLHRRLRESEILPTLAGVQYALEIGLDPVRHLQSMRSRLIRLREDMEAARRSHSEVVLKDAAAKLGSALDLSRQIRAVMDRVPVSNRQARRIVQDIHSLLSRLHVVASDLQSAIAQVGRQYLRLTAGLTVEQIVRALMRRSLGELAALGREALLPFHVPPPLLTIDVMASAAEMQFLRERPSVEPVRWEEPPDAPVLEDAADAPEEVTAFLADLAAVAAKELPTSFRDLLPKKDSATSFLRASLISLAGQAGAGEGVAGRLGSLPIDVRAGGDGWPDALEQAPLSRLTPGRAQRRKEKEDKP